MRNAVFRRVTTRYSASSLAIAARARKSRSRGCFSKYSTRQGAHSVSTSSPGKSDIRFYIVTKPATYKAKQPGLLVWFGHQEVIKRVVVFPMAGLERDSSSRLESGHDLRRITIRHDYGVDLSG